MDKYDFEILYELAQDSTISFKKIGEKINLTPSAVIDRFEKLKEKKIFKGTNTLIDIKKLRYEGKATLFIKNIHGKHFDTKISKLQKICNVIMVIKTMGKFDSIIMIAFKNISEIFEAIDFLKFLERQITIEVALTQDTQYPYRIEMKESTLNLLKTQKETIKE